MSYKPYYENGWKSGEEGGTPITPEALNHMEEGIEQAYEDLAAKSHGNHVPATQTANSATFLRNDNTWQTVTPANIGAAASSHNHAASNITSGTLAVARGGTGVTSNPSMLTNLGSTTAASVFAASPRPGVTGTLPIANGGTGATTRLAAAKNLTNEAVSSPNYVVSLTSNWGKFGYTSIAQLKTSLNLSPAMNAGTEYETNEKFMNKTVYARVVDLGSVPANSYKNTKVTNTGNVRIIELRGYSDTYFVPFPETNPGWGRGKFTLHANCVESSYICITANCASSTAQPCVVIVKYIKV